MFDKIFWAFGLHWVDGYLRDVASGKHGATAQRVYLYMQGKKTVTGVLLLAVAVALVAAGQNAAAISTLAVSYLLVRFGVVDSAWRSVTTYEDWGFFKFLRSNAPLITAILGSALAAFTKCDPATAELLGRLHVGAHHLTCGAAVMIITMLGMEFQVAVGKAKLAEAPKGKGLVIQTVAPMGLDTKK